MGERMNACDHCWHPTQMLLSMPPVYAEQCCLCEVVRHRRDKGLTRRPGCRFGMKVAAPQGDSDG